MDVNQGTTGDVLIFGFVIISLNYNYYQKGYSLGLKFYCSIIKISENNIAILVQTNNIGVKNLQHLCISYVLKL